MDFLENLRHLRLTPKKKKKKKREMVELQGEPKAVSSVDPFGAHRRRSSLRSRLSFGSASSLLKLPTFGAGSKNGGMNASSSVRGNRQTQKGGLGLGFRGDVSSLASSSIGSASAASDQRMEQEEQEWQRRGNAVARGEKGGKEK